METLNSPRLALALAGLTALVLVKSVQSALEWRRRSKGLPLPPGPKPLPLVGNYFDLPHTLPWECYQNMSKKYGDLIYFHAMGQGVLVLGSSKAALDLLENRSANYSDRPKTVIWESMGNDWFFSLVPYGPWWRSHRREFWQQFHPGALGKYDPIQQQEVHKFLKHLLDKPAEFRKDLQYMFGAIILRTVYNIDTEGRNDPVIVALQKALAGFSASLLPGSSILEFFPMLRLFPPFRKRLAQYKAAMASMRDLPYTQAKKRSDDSNYVPVLESMRERVLGSEEDVTERTESIMKNVAGIAYAGGGETTLSTLQTFFLAMSLYPQVQRKAQAELDAKIARDRLPDATDIDRLPYIGAMVKELLRWQNVTPLAVAHASVDDDVYEGYFIPAGTIVLPNVWAMLHDPSVYQDPMEFRPERFLKDGELDPEVPDSTLSAFGFGRRICPGRHFAERTIFIAIASVLSTFDITPPLDDNGRPFCIEPKQTNGLLSAPLDYRCTITPRSEAAVDLVLEAVKKLRL